MAWERACGVTDVAEGGVVRVEVDGLAVAIVHTGEDFYAIEDECSHAAVALSEGEVEGCEIECWMHGSRFDLRTGKPTGPPATEPVPIFPVRLEGADVLVDIDSPLNAG
ncbi:MAG TPA: non-heme iron oxygenase ferredoxin subunit [Marmoricola sp.]|nr:non-heme iron oxygenase ferredoxin subunit [Marmoricola sp.]